MSSDLETFKRLRNWVEELFESEINGLSVSRGYVVPLPLGKATQEVDRGRDLSTVIRHQGAHESPQQKS